MTFSIGYLLLLGALFWFAFSWLLQRSDERVLRFLTDPYSSARVRGNGEGSPTGQTGQYEDDHREGETDEKRRPSGSMVGRWRRADKYNGAVGTGRPGSRDASTSRPYARSTVSRRTSCWWKVPSWVSPVARYHEQLAAPSGVLGDQERTRPAEALVYPAASVTLLPLITDVHREVILAAGGCGPSRRENPQCVFPAWQQRCGAAAQILTTASHADATPPESGCASSNEVLVVADLLAMGYVLPGYS